MLTLLPSLPAWLAPVVCVRVQMAGQESGLDVVSKAKKAVSSIKVLQALQSILELLQVSGAGRVRA